MKLIKLATATLTIAGSTIVGFSNAVADPVDTTAVTTFQSGTPALASEVNGTVQALISAIDDNAARIAALEAANTLTPASVEGSTYCIMSVTGSVGAGDPDPVSGVGQWLGTAAGQSKYSLTFTSSTQATFATLSDVFYEALAPNNVMVDAGDSPSSETVTWTLVGNALTLTFPGPDNVSALISSDGNVLVAGFSELDRASDNSGNWFLADLLVGVRAASCN